MSSTLLSENLNLLGALGQFQACKWHTSDPLKVDAQLLTWNNDECA